jgi:AAA family ATP:ADP antiporter
MSGSATGPDKDTIALLRPIVQVRRSELGPMLASMLWIFLALTAYYIIKPLRSSVLQQQIGVDNKWIALIATTAFVGVFAYAYGKIVSRVPRSKLIVATFLTFMACLAAFALALPLGGSLTGYVFFVWVSTFNLMVVSQFWSLAADVWTKEEGLRLFGFIGNGAVAGGIFGTVVVSAFAKKLSTAQMLFLSAGLLGACLVLSLYILRFGADRAAAKPQVEEKKDDKKEEPKPEQNSIAMVLTSPYLRLIAAMMLLLNIVNTGNEWVMDKLIHAAHMPKEAETEFYGQYYLFQNVLTFLIQFFLTARIQRAFGARGALFFEPLAGIIGGALFLISPILAVIRWHKIVENACDYSIQSNTKEALYLPVSKIEKYSAKNANDTFVVRTGDALAAGLIFAMGEFILPKLGDMGLKVMIGFNVFLGVVWLVTANAVGKRHREKMQSIEAEKRAATEGG